MFERQYAEACITGLLTPITQEIWTSDDLSQVIFSLLGLVSWRSMLQSVSVLSTMNAEYMALMKASNEAIWLKSLANGISLKQGSVKVKYAIKMLYVLRRIKSFKQG